MNIGIIILAAGASSRMGRSKLDLVVDGDALLNHIVKASQETEASIIIVVKGAHALPHLRQPYKVISNDNWQLGIGSSIKTGLKFMLDNDPSIDGALFLVADQPHITSSHLISLIREFTSSNAIVASHYDGTAGVPAIFPKTIFSQIEALEDEQGAKAIIQKNQNQVRLMEFPKGEIDLDTPDDYRNFLETKKL